ncbi:MAG: histidine phosphatase family protein [Planctomycetaceae bacterium]
MARIILVRPGSTDFDEQGRIKGTLDIPLSKAGTSQVSRIVEELHDTKIDYLYTSPCRSAIQTAEAIAKDHRLRSKSLEDLQNLDHGLWQGKLVDEVRQNQPKVYRQLQDNPATVCPPEGEPVGMCIDRVRTALVRLLKKHKTGSVCLVIPEPCASLVRSTLQNCDFGDLWKAECECGSWQLIEVQAGDLAVAQ